MNALPTSFASASQESILQNLLNTEDSNNIQIQGKNLRYIHMDFELKHLELSSEESLPSTEGLCLTPPTTPGKWQIHTIFDLK